MYKLLISSTHRNHDTTITLFVFCVIGLNLIAHSQGGNENLRWLETALFHERVFKKIFFEYPMNATNLGISPSGKCAFILPDSVFRTAFPEIFERIDSSWPSEKMVATTRLIKNPKGTVYASAHATNIGIETWIRFDKLHVSDDVIKLTLHTTDYNGKSPTKDFNYYRLYAILKKHRSDWRVTSIRIKEIECCDDFEEFSRGFTREY